MTLHTEEKGHKEVTSTRPVIIFLCQMRASFNLATVEISAARLYHKSSTDHIMHCIETKRRNDV